MKKISCLLFMIGILDISIAQNLSFTGFLPAVSFTGRISERIDYNLFGSTTVNAIDKKILGVEYPAKDIQLYIQPSLVYKFSPNFNTSFSYTFVRGSSIPVNNYSNEHRLWEQIIYGHSFSKFRVTNRVRFEQRFIENLSKRTYPISTRLRYQLGCNFPLQGRTLEKNEFYLNAYNEFYFSLTGDKNATYSANWSYAGIGYHLGAMGKLELGYLLQTSVRNAKKDLQFLNLCQATWICNFNFRNRKK